MKNKLTAQGVKIWANDFETNNGSYRAYSTSIGAKNQNDEWNNAYLPLRFRKGVKLENGAKIDIEDGFLTVDAYKNRDGKTVTRLCCLVMEYTEHDSQQQAPQYDDFAQAEGDLPF